MTTPVDQTALALAEWRRIHWGELDKSLQTLIDIRDKAPQAKDRIEAVKGIARLLGGMSTRPADAMKPKETEAAKKASMTPEEADEVKAILGSRRYAKRPADPETV